MRKFLRCNEMGFYDKCGKGLPTETEFWSSDGRPSSLTMKANRCALVCTLSLTLTLCVLSGCKKKEEKSNQQPTPTTAPASTTPVAPPQAQAESKPFVSLTDRNAEPTVLSTPPPDMFDLKAHPDASILTAM